MMFEPTYLGYSLFTQVIHRNYYTGILHGIFLPVAAIGLMFIIHSLIKKLYRFDSNHAVREKTEKVMWYILGWFSCCYASYDVYYGAITILFYYCLMNQGIKAGPNLLWGILLMGLSVGMMEFVGHWYLENGASNLSHFFNSVIHTPLYGVRSILNQIVIK